MLKPLNCMGGKTIYLDGESTLELPCPSLAHYLDPGCCRLLALPACRGPVPASLVLTDCSGQIIPPEHVKSRIQPTHIEHLLCASACARPGEPVGSLLGLVSHAHFPAPASFLILKTWLTAGSACRPGAPAPS